MAQVNMDTETKTLIDTTGLQGNSNRDKQKKKEAEERRPQKIITSEVTTKEKSATKKFAEKFFEDEVSNVKTYILWDVIIPAIKNVISDIVGNSVDMMLYGRTRNRSAKNPSTGTTMVGGLSSYTGYGSFSSRQTGISQRNRSNYDLDEFVFQSRADAEMVLDTLKEIVSKYKAASVADLCDLIGRSSQYTDVKYGWTDLRGADVQRVREGYVLIMPRVTLIE